LITRKRKFYLLRTKSGKFQNNEDRLSCFYVTCVAWSCCLFSYKGLPEPVRINRISIPRFLYFRSSRIGVVAVCVMEHKYKYMLMAFVLLSIGATVYLTCRQNVLFLSHFQNSAFLSCIKLNIDYDNCNGWTYIFIFCLPDALWYLALLLVNIIFFQSGIVNKILFYASAALPFVWEYMQYAGIINGTFDWIDIFIYLLILISFLLWQRKYLCCCKSH